MRLEVPQVPGCHVSGGMASPLEVAVGPVDFGLGGAGGVQRGAGGPVQEHVGAVGVSHFRWLRLLLRIQKFANGVRGNFNRRA